MVVEDSIQIITNLIKKTLLLNTFQNKLYVVGIHNTDDINAASLPGLTNLQKQEYRLVTHVVIYLSHILVALSKINEPFQDFELEYIIEALERFSRLINLYFLHSFPVGLKPSCMDGLTSVTELIYNTSCFYIKELNEVDRDTLNMYNGYSIGKILESIIDAYSIKRAELFVEKDKAEEVKEMKKRAEQLEKEAAEKRAAEAEAELLSLLSSEKKSNKTKKNVTKKTSLPAVAVKPSTEPTLSEKAFSSAIERMINGEVELYAKLIDSYTLTPQQELECKEVLG
jgi:hypothetical protein